MANLRVAPQRARTAAGHIGENNVVPCRFFKRGDIGETAFDPRIQSLQPLLQSLQPLRAHFTGHDARFRIPLCKNQCLSTGSGTAIENRPAARHKLRNQLRPLILKPNASLAPCRSSP